MDGLIFVICFVLSGIFIGLWLVGFFSVLAAAFLGFIAGLVCAFAGVLVTDL